MQTYAMKASEIDKKWYVIDAKDMVLGRLSAIISTYLQGKNKPTYSPNLDCGDNIIVINASHVHMTGKKLDPKHGVKFYKHTGYMGGIKETTASKIITGKFPERLIQNCVKRMLKKTKIGYKHISNLYVYNEDNHPHEAQKPELLDLAKLNPKNKKRN